MNKKEALSCIIRGDYESVPKEFRQDKSFVLQAVKQDGLALKYANESLKNDTDIIKAAESYKF